MKAVVTVIGKDMGGIIYKVSKILFEANINILDISQTIMEDMFTMIMLVDINNANVPFDSLVDSLASLGTELGLSIHAQHENIFQAMHKI